MYKKIEIDNNMSFSLSSNTGDNIYDITNNSYYYYYYFNGKWIELENSIYNEKRHLKMKRINKINRILS